MLTAKLIMTETETIALAGTIATDNLGNDVESPPLLPPSSTPILGSRSIGDTLPSNSSTSTLYVLSDYFLAKS